MKKIGQQRNKHVSAAAAASFLRAGRERRGPGAVARHWCEAAQAEAGGTAGSASQCLKFTLLFVLSGVSVVVNNL